MSIIHTVVTPVFSDRSGPPLDAHSPSTCGRISSKARLSEPLTTALVLPADSVLLFPMPPKQVAALHGGLVAGVLMRGVGFPWLPQVPPRRLVHVHVLVTTSQRPPATQRPRPNRRRALVSSQSLPEPSLALAFFSRSDQSDLEK